MITDTTPWELYKLLLEFEVVKDDLVKEYLLPVKNWTMLSSIKEGDCSTMEMTNVHVVTFPSRYLKDSQKDRINQTLGPRPTMAKADGTPAAGVKLKNELLVAMLSVHSANSQRQTEHSPGYLYPRLSTDAMRMFQENTSRATHKRF